MGNYYDVVVFCSHRETDEETGRRISYKSPLLSWTAHRGWCSQTQFPHHRLPRLASKDDTASRTGTSAGNANTNSYLLTAGGMDGTVCSWDLSGEFILIVAWAIQLTSCFVYSEIQRDGRSEVSVEARRRPRLRSLLDASLERRASRRVQRLDRAAGEFILLFMT